jgi:hypothetical protein
MFFCTKELHTPGYPNDIFDKCVTAEKFQSIGVNVGVIQSEVELIFFRWNGTNSVQKRW